MKSIKPASSLKKKLTFGIVCALVVGLTASFIVSNNLDAQSSNPTDTPRSVISALESADKIGIKRETDSLGDQWKVSADGQEVGVIRSEKLKSIGDTYSLFSSSGKIVGSEAETYRVENGRAKIYDHKAKVSGEIRPKLAPLFSEYDFISTNGKVQGVAKEKIAGFMKFEVKGSSGEPNFEINGSFLPFSDSVVIKRKTDSTSVKATDVLWFAVIASQVDKEAKEKDHQIKYR